ncbi:membrane protein, partial [Listeria monocytogenes]|uniref:TerC family protein n=1 Tax=Listeria monocytogenes TaxID=1639 RepID=UPI003D76795B
MNVYIWGEYALVFVVLVVLEGILSADNDVVMAVIVKGLPDDKKRKALFYGLVGAFVFRVVALFLISFLVKIWEIQAIVAVYFLYLAIKHMWRLTNGKQEEVKEAAEAKSTSLWGLVARVALTDIT